MHTPPSVLWNQGGLVFRKETLDVDGSRAVNAVDVDGDGRLDLVFTHAGNRPSLWRTDVGLAPPASQRVPPRQFIGRYNPYSIAWADLDDDTDLDMVGASYNAELMAHGFGTPSGGGVFLFTNEGGALKPDLLDNDGALDLYVVNGMINEGLFGDFPGDELVEENQALRNDGTGHFAPAPEWGLGATESGRGMSFADLDNDGDLDIVVNNFAKPSVLFENRLCGGAAMQVELHWEGSLNSRAIGAQLRLHTDGGRYVREMRASSGYISSLPARVHFGLGDAAGRDVQLLEVVWPDGSRSQVDDPPIDSLLEIRRPVAASQPAP